MKIKKLKNHLRIKTFKSHTAVQNFNLDDIFTITEEVTKEKLTDKPHCQFKGIINLNIYQTALTTNPTTIFFTALQRGISKYQFFLYH